MLAAAVKTKVQNIRRLRHLQCPSHRSTGEVLRAMTQEPVIRTSPPELPTPARTGRERKLKLIASMGGKCSGCGCARNYAALEFHHVKPAEKLFQLDMRSLANLQRVLVVAEARKCRLLTRIVMRNGTIRMHSHAEKAIVPIEPYRRRRLRRPCRYIWHRMGLWDDLLSATVWSGDGISSRHAERTAISVRVVARPPAMPRAPTERGRDRDVISLSLRC